MKILHLARTGGDFVSSGTYEGVVFTARSAASQGDADRKVFDEAAYQLCKRWRGFPNKLDGTL